MIAADHDRSRHRTRADELVDRPAGLRPVAEAEPADPRGQPLEGDALRRELEPALQQLVVREELPQRLVDRGDVRRIAGESGPAERPDPAAEERPDVRRHEARDTRTRRRGPRHAPRRGGCCRSRRHGCPPATYASIASTCRTIDARARRRYSSGSRRAQRRGLVDRQATRDIAGQRIVRCGLVGDQVESLAAPGELRARRRPHCRAARPTAPGPPRRQRGRARPRRRATRSPRRGSASRVAARSGWDRPRRRGSRRRRASRRAVARRPSRRGPP